MAGCLHRGWECVVTQCVSLWCGFSLVLVLLALAEWRLLRDRGVEYIPKNTVQQVSVRAFSVSADGRWAASTMSFRRGGFDAQAVDDIVVHDLERQTARRLHLGDMDALFGGSFAHRRIARDRLSRWLRPCRRGVRPAVSVAGRVTETKCLLRGSAMRRSDVSSFLPTVAPWQWHEIVKSTCSRFRKTRRSCPPEDNGFLHPCSQTGDCGPWPCQRQFGRS